MQEFSDFFSNTGIANLDWRQAIMILIGISFIVLAIRKKLEPYELLPIGLGIIAANLPLTGLVDSPMDTNEVQGAGIFLSLIHI